MKIKLIKMQNIYRTTMKAQPETEINIFIRIAKMKSSFVSPFTTVLVANN